MIELIEALNYRSLRYVKRTLEPYQVLVGPNASGKTTFLEIISFLGSLVSNGLEQAIYERTSNIRDLFWNRQGNNFELAIEAKIPEQLLNQFRNQQDHERERQTKKKRSSHEFNSIRYEVSIGLNESDEIAILGERGFFKQSHTTSFHQKEIFPFINYIPKTILPDRHNNTRTIFNKTQKGYDIYYSEASTTGGGWTPTARLGHRKSTFGNLIPEENNFPVSTWLKTLLVDGVQTFILNSILIRRPSPPGQLKGFKTDGSNIPWVIKRFKEQNPDRFKDWIFHLQTALPDIQDIRTKLREEDYHQYLTIVYSNNLEVPSWMASDGTLRLLALTLPAYLPSFEGVYLIEEPENGIHPKAVETVMQSLSSVYDAQVLVATHSPVILGVTPAQNILCFAKDEAGATDIVKGTEHPMLRDWKNDEDLGLLFASGILG